MRRVDFEGRGATVFEGMEISHQIAVLRGRSAFAAPSGPRLLCAGRSIGVNFAGTRSQCARQAAKGQWFICAGIGSIRGDFGHQALCPGVPWVLGDVCCRRSRFDDSWLARLSQKFGKT